MSTQPSAKQKGKFTFRCQIGPMSRISGLRNDMNKRTFYKERINMSKQNIMVPLILDINVREWCNYFNVDTTFIKTIKIFVFHFICILKLFVHLICALSDASSCNTYFFASDDESFCAYFFFFFRKSTLKKEALTFWF